MDTNPPKVKEDDSTEQADKIEKKVTFADPISQDIPTHYCGYQEVYYHILYCAMIMTLYFLFVTMITTFSHTVTTQWLIVKETDTLLLKLNIGKIDKERVSLLKAK